MALSHPDRHAFSVLRPAACWLLGLCWPLMAVAQTPASPEAAAFQVRLWAASCMACHGPGGRAEGTGLSLAGRPAQDLLSKMLGYKSGKLPATIMHQHTRGYSDEELSLIADHFASLKP